jgi:hypothetical protein
MHGRIVDGRRRRRRHTAGGEGRVLAGLSIFAAWVVPRVDVRDPLQPHRDLLGVYTDADIHDVTAFLVTLK